MTESGYEDGLRALLGTMLLLGIIGCLLFIVYRLVVCRDEEDKRNRARFSGTTRGANVNQDDKIYLPVQPQSYQLEV
jgi:hypothetical protein